MGKRKRRLRILKECNRSKRLSKIIGRALAGVVDPAGNFRNPDAPPWPELDLEQLGAVAVVNDPRKPGDPLDEGKAMVWLSDTVASRRAGLVAPLSFLIKPV